jgi:type II secretory pathway pseudopilin PulG
MPERSYKNFGFSLIELLILISIIGLLAILVLTAVLQSRQKTFDARIRNNIVQLRWEAEIVFDSQGANFINWSTYPSVDNEVNILVSDIADALQGAGTATIRDADPNTYCVSAPLASTSGRHYCVDYRGVFDEVGSPCSAAPPFECPAS